MHAIYNISTLDLRSETHHLDPRRSEADPRFRTPSYGPLCNCAHRSQWVVRIWLKVTARGHSQPNTCTTLNIYQHASRNSQSWRNGSVAMRALPWKLVTKAIAIFQKTLLKTFHVNVPTRSNYWRKMRKIAVNRPFWFFFRPLLNLSEN